MDDSSNVRWEYTAHSIDTTYTEDEEEDNEYRDAFFKKINSLGKKGWELIGVIHDDYFIFKRRLP